MANLVDSARLATLLTGTIWGPIQVVAETGSTNADLLAAAASGAGEGRVLVAEQQTAGRGRFNRAWITQTGDSIALSVLLRPKLELSYWPWLSAACGMAVKQGIERATGVTPGRVVLKWPNDVLLDSKKVCGILAEQTSNRIAPTGQGPTNPQASPKKARALVLGIGINTGMTTERLPVSAATSLQLAGLDADVTDLVAQVLLALETLYLEWGRTGTLRDRYREQLGTIGCQVRVILGPGEEATGRAIDIDSQGCLVVEVAGEEKVFSAGDVVHLR